MSRRDLGRLLTPLIAAIWIGFGLFCKVLDLVPRHEQIVARILGPDGAGPITRTIGVLEVVMGLWILSGLKRRWNAVSQIVLVGVMNALELWLAPDLLLWGRLNGIFALALIGLIYVNEWVLDGRDGG